MHVPQRHCNIVPLSLLTIVVEYHPFNLLKLKMSIYFDLRKRAILLFPYIVLLSGNPAIVSKCFSYNRGWPFLMVTSSMHPSGSTKQIGHFSPDWKLPKFGYRLWRTRKQRQQCQHWPICLKCLRVNVAGHLSGL